jgi:hypothetical protein
MVAWWVPLRCPRCLSAPFLTQNFKKNFLDFSRNFIFEDFSEIDKRLKTRENKDGTIESEFKPSLQQL